MPIDYKQYPPNWKTEIRPRILARANNRCELCGVENHSYIIRSSSDPAKYLLFDRTEMEYRLHGQLVRLSEIDDEFDASPEIKIVLTIAHLDHDKTHNDDDNLKALCQRCHLNHDRTHHISNAKRTRAKAKHATIQNNGQMELLGGNE